MSLRKGWCPGALRPMLSGDGYLVRVKPRCGALSGAQARGIAAAAARFGNGQIELTQRANLQIRGVREAGLPGAIAALDALGLIDANAEAEAVRNVIVAPLAGLDPTAAFDVRPAAAALEARLVADRALHGLPGKFGFVVDDGGSMSLADVRADIRFEARGEGFVVMLDGAEPALRCKVDEVADVAAKLALAFLAQAGEGERMRDVAARLGGEAIIVAARLVDSVVDRIGATPRISANEARRTWLATASTIGFAAPFGRCDARQFAMLAQEIGDGELRLTPWRMVFAPGLTEPARARLAIAGWITTPDDPRQNIAACPGAPACASATTSVIDDATRLAARLPAGVVAHVSGCAKGCAHPRAARFTFVGRGGRYDLVENGAAGDVPTLLGLAGVELTNVLIMRASPPPSLAGEGKREASGEGSAAAPIYALDAPHQPSSGAARHLLSRRAGEELSGPAN